MFKSKMVLLLPASVGSARRRISVLTLVLLCGLSVGAHADPVVTLGTYFVSPGLASFPIPIFAYNDPSTGPNGSVQGLDLNIAIHDLTGVAPGPGGPVFVAGNPGQGNALNSAYVGGVGTNGGIGGDVLTGTIFGAFAGHTTPVDGGQSNSQGINLLAVGTGGTALPLGTAASPSLIATVYISTVGVAPGSTWVLSIGGFQNGDPGPDQGPLDFSDGGLFNTVLHDGIIGTPEPSSIVLAALGFAGTIACVWRRRRKRS